MGRNPAPPEPLTPQEMQELLSSLPREVPFRHSNRFVFYLVWMGGWMLFALWALFFGEDFTNSVAIPLIDRFGTAGFVGVMIFIVGSYVGFFLFFFFLARRIWHGGDCRNADRPWPQDKKGNTKWSQSSITGVLHNERHCGSILARKTWTPNYKTHRSRKNRGDRNQYKKHDHHEPIVSRDDFNTAQKMLANAKYRQLQLHACKAEWRGGRGRYHHSAV